MPPTPTPTPQPSASETPASCTGSSRLLRDSVPQGDFGREIPFTIYLPPCYSETAGGLPTLYLLHGLAGDDGQWPRLGVAAAADQLFEGGISPYLIVMPWQRTGLDSEPAIVDGLLPYVESHYRALPGGTWRAIGGLSRGAGWAFRIGLENPGRFSAIGLHSPALLSGDLTALDSWLRAAEGSHLPRIWIDIGDRDTLLEASDQLRLRLDDLGIAFDYHLGEGWHDEAYWRANVADYLRWYAARW